MTGPLEIALVVFFLLAGLSLAGLAVSVRSSPTGIRGTTVFTALLGLMSFWSFSAVVKLLAPISVERFLVALELPLGVCFSLLMFTFASTYTGRGWHRRRWFRLPAAAGLAVLAVGLVTNPIHGLFWAGIVRSTAVFPHLVHEGLGPLYMGYVAVAYGLYGAAMYLLLSLHFSSRYTTTSVLLIAFGGALPLLVNLVSLFDRAPIPGLDYTPIGLAAFGLAATWSMRLDFFDIVPIARDTAVEQSSEGMLILDDRCRIRDYNPTAVELLPGIAAHRGEHIEAVVPAVAEALTTDGPTHVEFTPDYDPARRLQIRPSRITDGPHQLGWTVTLSDVSARDRQQRHLELVSRVLRHNMANRINTIVGHTELLADHVDDGGRRHLAAIDRSADSIIETSGKLRTIQGIVTSDRTDRVVDLPTVVEAVRTDLSDRFPAATITVESPPSLSARCSVGCQAAIENLVENGIAHDPGPAPSVTITVEQSEETVTVAVADDGPGIPETERRIIETGETPLQHSAGVGLWLVYCFVEQSGHSLTFDSRPEGGSVVRFTLDRAD